jgi:diguanylate cyclase (GGDEF)-like protein
MRNTPPHPLQSASPFDDDLPLEERLHRQALQDTVARIAGGIYIYVILWLIITGITGVARQQPWLTGGFAAWLLLIGLLRTLHTRSFKRLLASRPAFAHRSMLALVLGNGLSWGLITAASISVTALEPIRMPLLIIAVGVTSGGSMSMAIDPILKTWFPIALIIPVSIAAALDATDANLLLASLITIYTFYIMQTTGTVHRDYWRALKASGELERASLTDALTQVANRMSFDRQYALEWRRASRRNDGLAVLVIDLDYFKKVNDTYGHAIGDRVLQHAARTLQESLLRAGDSVSRYGGEEFVVLLSNIDFSGATAVARRMRENLAASAVPLDEPGKTLSITCSIGYAWCHPDHKLQPEQLLKQADDALYEAKAGGRNQVRCGSTPPTAA